MRQQNLTCRVTAKLSAAKIRSAMRDAKLSAAETARRAGMSAQHFARILRGDRGNPAMDTALRIAGALGMPLERLVERMDIALIRRATSPPRTYVDGPKPYVDDLRPSDDVRRKSQRREGAGCGDAEMAGRPNKGNRRLRRKGERPGGGNRFVASTEGFAK
jgi:transcriptional regulator with XRE-family HTH domain